jgi:hypothetical protein
VEWSVAELERDQSLSPLVKISNWPPPPLGSPEDSSLGKLKQSLKRRK